MKIQLKKDWEISIQPPSHKGEIVGHYAGRKREVELIFNEILNKEQGSILVSGYRGVGKTATVYKALQLAVGRNPSLRIVLLNAAQLEAESSKNERIEPQKIIQNLIRRLYSSLEYNKINDDIRKDVEALYKKAVASEFRLKEFTEHGANIVAESSDSSKFEFSVSQEGIKNIVLLLAWAGAIVFAFLRPFPTEYDWINNILPLLMAVPLPFASMLFIRKEQALKRMQEQKKEAQELYQYDNSIGNLEYDLERVHNKFHDKQVKVVYVIDELDKLDSQKVIEVLKFFKNLFTLSKAIFIFVGNEDIFQETLKEQKGEKSSHRPQAYTYFSSRYFLPRPVWSDLSEFIEEIVDQPDVKKLDVEDFKRIVAYESRNDFFDMLSKIRDKISRYDLEGKPEIDLDKLTPEDVLKIKLHKVITLISESKYLAYQPSRWAENEEIQKRLYERANFVLAGYPGAQFNDDSSDSVIASAIRDFYGYLYRLGAFTIKAETLVNIRGLNVPIRTYSYIGEIPGNPATTPTTLSEIEKRFVAEYEAYLEYCGAFANIIKTDCHFIPKTSLIEDKEIVKDLNKVGFDFWGLFNSNFEVYKDLKLSATLPKVYKREEIDAKTKQLMAHVSSLKSVLHNVLAQVIVGWYPQLSLQKAQLQVNGNLFVGTSAKVRELFQSYPNHIVVFNKDYSKQIFLVNKGGEKLVSLKKTIEDNSGSCLVVLVEETPKKSVGKGMSVVAPDNPKNLCDQVFALKEIIGQFFVPDQQEAK